MNIRSFAIRYGFLLLLLGLVLFFSAVAEGFAGPRSAVFIFQSVSITGILALGVTATLVVDGFDLSIGSVATSALMLSAYVMVVLEMSAFMAINADISSTTITYAESISAEVATEPIERSNPSTTNVAVTPSAKIPVIETD